MAEENTFDFKAYIDERYGLSNNAAAFEEGIKQYTKFCPFCNGTDFAIYHSGVFNSDDVMWSCNCLSEYLENHKEILEPKLNKGKFPFKLKEMYQPVEFFMLYDKVQYRTAANKIKKLTAEQPKQEEVEQDQEEVFELKTLDYARFAKYLVNKYNYSFIDKMLCVKDGDIYRIVNDEDIEFTIMDNIYNSKISHRKEITRYVRRFATKRTPSHKKYILFNNGVYNLEKKELEPFQDDMVFFNKIPVDYNPMVKQCVPVDNFFNGISCNDEQIKTLLIQMIGYCLYRDNVMSKFFILQGEGSNGKSTLFEFIMKLLGADNFSDLELISFSDKFGVGAIRHKLVNLGDDIDDVYIEKCATIKKAVTGEPITVEEKFQPKYSMRYYGKLIFSANSLPKMSDKTNGMKRRLIIVPMKAKFEGKNNNENILDDITTKEALEYTIMLAIEQLHIILKTKEFISSDAVRRATDAYNKENNPIIQFLEDVNGYKMEYRKGKKLPLPYLFSLWESYCIKNNIKTMKSLDSFKKDIEMNGAYCGLGKVTIKRSKANVEESRLFQAYGVEHRENIWFLYDYYILEEKERQLDMDYANAMSHTK